LRLRLKKLRPIQIFEIYKEKEMPEFRKWIIASAGLALFAGLASAQVGPSGGAASGTTFTCGVTNGAVTPTLRAEGYTELTGDIVLICSGGSAPASGTLIPTANFTVFLNTTVTSRLLGNGGQTNASEALLLVDEPGSSVGGYGPSVLQTPCSSTTFGAGPGGCTEYVGATAGSVAQGYGAGVPVAPPTAGTAPTASQCTVGAPCTAGANIFQGIVTGNQVVFNGIPVLPPASSGVTRVYRITNIRANANQIVSGGATPGAVTASLSINSSSSIPITNSTLTTGFVLPGLAPLFRNTANSSTASSSGTTFAQCTSTSVTSTSSSSGALGVLQFTENFDTAFKIRQAPTTQNIPGQIYNSESGFIVSSLAGSNTSTGSPVTAGLADYGTRLKATFSNVPSGVTLYVTTRDVNNDFNIGNATAAAVEVVSETAVDSGSPGTPVLPQSSQVLAYGLIPAIGLSPVVTNPTTGVGEAVWEVIAANANAIDTVNFGVYISYTAAAASNSPAAGTMTVTLSFAPTPSGGAFTSTTGAAASGTLTIPRFSDSLDVTKTIATISLCTTPMLFPYVINVNGFDTGLAIANTTSDPFGTAAQTGTCSLYFYGSSAPTTIPYVTPVVATGTDWTSLASTLAPGFSGYMIANCNFQYAHGFAFISDVGARNLAMGYLALIFYNSTLLNRGTSSAEQLNN
jgi:hypothetical protein